MVDKCQAVRMRFNRVLRKLAINSIWMSALFKKPLSAKADYKEITELSEDACKLIRIPPPLRTVDERRKILRIFAELGCLQEYPPKIRARLSRVAHYAEYKAEQLLCAEKTVPMTSYLLIAGKVDSFKWAYNERKKKYVKQRDMLNIFGSGTFLGNYSIFWGTIRRSSIAAITTIDVLIINDTDLREIVMPYWKNHFNEKMAALRLLPYFDHFSEAQITEACKLCTLKQYNVYDTIYTQDEGNLSEVYFVLSGECMIVQNLRVVTQIRKGQKVYRLAEPSADNDFGSISNASLSDPLFFDEADVEDALRSEHSEIFDIRSAFNKCNMPMPDLAYLNFPSVPRGRKKDEGVHSVYRYFFEKNSDNSDEDAAKDIKIKVVKQVERMRSIATEQSLMRRQTRMSSFVDQEPDPDPDMIDEIDPKVKRVRRPTGFQIGEYLSSSSESITSSGDDIKICEECEDNYDLKDDDQDDDDDDDSDSAELDYVDYGNTWNKRFKSAADMRPIRGTVSTLVPDHHNTIPAEKHHSARSSLSSMGSSPSFTSLDIPETHLIDVGTIRNNGIFGLGEKSVNRLIIARSNVQVLTLPRFWLFQRAQNTNGVWRVRRLMIEQALPTRERIFEMFVKECEWPKFKNKFVNSVLNPDTLANNTHSNDIPAMLQI